MPLIPEILTIGEMIDSAFGDPEKNVVHHKLIQAVLYILARQLRVLDRRVKIELFNNIDFYSSGSSLSVTEVKIQASIKKKRRTQKDTGSARVKIGPTEKIGPSEEKGGRMKNDGTAERIGPTGAIAPSKIKGAPDTSQKSTAEILHEYAKGNVSITEIKMRSLKSGEMKKKELGTTGAEIAFPDEDSSDQSLTDKSVSDQIIPERTSTFNREKTTYDTHEKSSTDKSSSDKTSTEKTSTDKTSTDKTSTDKTSTDKTSTDKTSTDKTSTEKSTTDKSTSEKTPTTSTDKTTTEISSGKTTTEKTTSSSKPTTSSSSGKHAKRKVISDFEMQREKELRIIHQRADSREEHEKTPTPMASMDSVEVQYEKLLVVERLSSDEAKARVGRLQGETRGPVPQLSIVTQEEFSKLAADVRTLQSKFDPVGAANFPENAQLMQELRKGASLTDAMAALQLSARLEAAEKALTKMTSLVTDLARKYPDIDISALLQQGEPDTQVLYHGAPGPSSQVPPRLSKTAAFKQPPKPIKPPPPPVIELSKESIEDFSLMPSMSTAVEKDEVIEDDEVGDDDHSKWITHEELDTALQEIYDGLISEVIGLMNKSKTNADAALKMANRLDSKLTAALELGDHMISLETLVAEYAEKVNSLDTGLSSQMTNYQEQLTQMQHDLETGLENMAEALANTGGDTTAITELNAHFTNLQLDFETTNSRQNELNEIQTALRLQLNDLQNQIEILRETKSDRDEVADALRDKVGLETLNGMISLEQFNAVRGDLEQRIGAAYDKFNNQEIIWQKAIDELLRELGEKADLTQVLFLREDIQNNIQKLNNRLKIMLDIVGEPQAAAVAKKLYRETNCLSCSAPAHLDIEGSTVPQLPAMPGVRPPTLGAESPRKQTDDGHGLCYPTYQIPHPREPKAHICHRYCGGSHTKVSAVGRTPAGLAVSPAIPRDDMKAENIVKKPCIPCNVKPKVTKEKSEAQQKRISEDVVEKEDVVSEGSDMTPEDFVRLTSLRTEESKDADAETPPIPVEE